MGLFRTDLPVPVTWPPPREEDGVAALLRYVRERDPIGHRVHGAFALAHLALLPLSAAGTSITFALLVGYAIIRLPNTWRCYTPLLRVAILWAFLAWTAWTALSLAWSRDPMQGADEVWSFHMLLLAPALWPVLELAPCLIGAALAGVAAQQAAQILQALHWFDLREGVDPPGRYGGLIHPIKTGAWCVTAMCWHLAALLMPGGRIRIIALGGLVLAAGGLLATQSRGPWVAAALTLPLALVVIALRRPPARRAAVIVAGLGVAGIVAGWPIAGHIVTERVDAAVQEYRDAREHAGYETAVGLRVGQTEWAWSMFSGAPAFGVGAGSFRAALEDQPSFVAARDRVAHDPALVNVITRDHPHQTFLHVLATTGVVGGLLLLAIVLLALRAARRDPPNHLYANGTLFVIVSWLVGGLFDCYHLSGHYLGIFVVAVSVTMRFRLPPVRCSMTGWRGLALRGEAAGSQGVEPLPR